MMSPTGLQKDAGPDFAQNYLTTHDLGTGPYTLTDAQVGSHYVMASFPEYWGPKPYFEKVRLEGTKDFYASPVAAGASTWWTAKGWALCSNKPRRWRY